MFRSTLVFFLSISWFAASAFGQPREWSDDFTTAATYDDASRKAPCYGPAPSTKYTMVEVFTGETKNDRAVSGGGSLLVSSRLVRLSEKRRYLASSCFYCPYSMLCDIICHKFARRNR